jgi:hypothetical protein
MFTSYTHGRSLKKIYLTTVFEKHSYSTFAFAGIPQPSTQYRITSSTEPSIPPEKGKQWQDGNKQV